MPTIVHKLIALIKQPKLVAVLAVGLLVGGAGGAVVMAAIPDTSGVIHGCYKNPSFLSSGGAVRIIDSATQSCTSSETAVNWNSATPGQFVTNLVGADFTDTSLAYRNFTGQDMHGSTFGKSLTGAVFKSANLSSSSIGGPMNNTNFSGANLSSATIGGQALSANFSNVNFNGSTWNSFSGRGNQGRANFTGITLNGAAFAGGALQTSLQLS
jgi:uncharacterized protein YjbI with pentapeptide repeats